MPRTTANSIDAICRGAGDGFHLALNIIAMLIAFIAIIALANYVVGLPQTHLGVNNPVTLPDVFRLGQRAVRLAHGRAGAGLREHRTNPRRTHRAERICRLPRSHEPRQKLALDPRSFTIATYALCGFANFSSIAIQVGGIGSLAPERRSEMAKLGFRAMVGGLLAAYMTASLAGFLL